MGEFMQPRRRRSAAQLSVAETICESIAHAAEDLPMGAIAVFTETGNTARMLSKHRPKARIFAFSRGEAICNRMNFLWGVHPVHHVRWTSTEEMVSTAERELQRRGEIRTGDVLGVVAGTSLSSGSTNFMRLHSVVRSEPRGRSAKGRRK
jgi:pyruvate kinase